MSFAPTLLPDTEVVAGRHPWIVARCRGQRVLHLGCVDSGLLEERFARGDLLHQKIDRVAAEVCGLDIDRAGMDFLARQGFDDLVTGDVTEEATLAVLQGREFDVIVASEIIEHLDNPGAFLHHIKRLMGPETELLVTVPNAFSIHVLLGMLRGEERVHPDHNYWFSHATARRLLVSSGFDVRESAVYSFENRLVPVRLARRLGWKTTTVIAEEPGEATTASAQRPPAKRAGSWLRRARALPRRAIVSSLYRRTGFFAEGLLFVVRLGAR